MHKCKNIPVRYYGYASLCHRVYVRHENVWQVLLFLPRFPQQWCQLMWSEMQHNCNYNQRLSMSLNICHYICLSKYLFVCLNVCLPVIKLHFQVNFVKIWSNYLIGSYFFIFIWYKNVLQDIRKLNLYIDIFFKKSTYFTNEKKICV